MKLRTGLVAVPLWLLLPGGTAGGVQHEEQESPRLVVFVVVDQLRGDYLDRFSHLFQAGFRTLLERSIQFTDAHHNHATTSTAPGHASLATGVVPARSGMIDNAWFDRELGDAVNCVEDRAAGILGSTSSGRSPRHLLVDTLADWIKSVSPDSKVFAASRKDRGAILLAGHRAEGAFWYDADTGDFVTSSYYMAQYPGWLRDFRERNIPDESFGTLWEPIPVSEGELEKTGIHPVGDTPGFPHRIGSTSLLPNKQFYEAFGATPDMDEYLLELILTLIRAEGLGQDPYLDFVGISFSVLDSVGHTYGPNSRELLDALLRLDRVLGRLFDFLDREVGLERVLVALSADHGVMPLPELLPQLGLQGGRFQAPDVQCYQQTMASFEEEFGEDDWVLEGLYLNYETLGRRNLLRSDVEKRLGALMARCQAVARVWTRTELEEPNFSHPENGFLQLYRNSFHPGRSPDFWIQLKPYRLGSTGDGTSHGSPYEYDSHVPLLVMVPGQKAVRIPGRVHTTDLAPTLATLLGIPVPAGLDGVDLSRRVPSVSADERAGSGRP